MKKIVITGGTGFIGKSLAKYLSDKGYHPILIARSKPKNLDFEFHKWDGTNTGSWTQSLENAIAVINLAGKSVDCIKTPDNCDLILRSRIDSVRAVGNALRQVSNPPKIWLQVSTAHIYGDPPQQWCTESSAFGYGLAPYVGQEWEKALLEYLPEGCREVRLRTSFVIGKNGGALASLKRIAKLGLGGTAGSGTQGMCWIHQNDINEIILQSIENENYTGAIIVSSPNPVSNKVFMKMLRKVMRIPIGLPAPDFLISFGARYFFKTDPELVLYGRYVKSERLDNLGFTFKFPELENALKDLIND